MKLTIGTMLVAALIILAVFLAVSFVVMLLANVVLGHYDIKLLDYPTALAVTLLSIILFGGSRLGSNNG